MKFSVLIPTYKEKYLRECIDSILKQTICDFEVIIVNDASPEDIDSIVLSFNDRRIKYYKNTINYGAVDVVHNWNKCLEYAIGDYILCMGDDDRLLPYCLEEYSKLVDKYPNLNIYHGWTEIIDENSNIVDICSPRLEFESVFTMLYYRWSGRRQFIGDFLFRRDALSKDGGFYYIPYAWGADDISVARAAWPKGIANTQTVVFQYRVNSQTITMTGNNEMKYQSLLSAKEWFANFLNLKKKDETLSDKYWLLCQRNFNEFFHRQLVWTITNDLLSASCFRIIYWVKKRKEYRIPVKMIMTASYYYLENSLRNRLLKRI